MKKDERIKLTFRRQYKLRVSGFPTPTGPVNYTLEQIEGAATATLDYNGNKSTHRVGETVPEATVKAFAEIKRDFSVKVKS